MAAADGVSNDHLPMINSGRPGVPDAPPDHGAPPTAAPPRTTNRLGPVLGIFPEPEDDRGDDQSGPKVGGSFGVAGGQGPELLESGEAAFDDLASGIDVLVEGGWPAAGGALGLPPGDLVGLLRAGEGNASAAQRGPGGGVGVGLVGDHPVRTLPWSSWPGAGDRY